MMKKSLMVAAMTSAVVAGVMCAGCKSDKQAGQSVCQVYEEANKIESASKAECIRLFDNQSGKVTAGTQFDLAAGTQQEPRVVGDTGEIYYVVSGAGMIKINDTAFVLRDGNGVYVPPNSRLTVMNNSSAPAKFAMVVKSLPWLGDSVRRTPMSFDKREPGVVSKNYNEVVGNKPMNMGTQEFKTTTLSPNEAKVKTLDQERYQSQ